MTAADIPAAMLLKEAAGWNQTAGDWENLLAIEPDGCWVYEINGLVVGSGTAICYGTDLAWIGMVLTLPEFRRRGIAREMMRHAVTFCGERGVRVVKLDGTTMGRPLYEQFGFVVEEPIERWGCMAASAGAVNEASPGDLPRAVEIDREAFGADRSFVLERLARQFRAEFLGCPDGYVLARPGSKAHYLGPCAARNAAAAESLIRPLLARHRGERMFWDLLPANQEAAALARSLGFEPIRKLVRMGRPPTPVGQTGLVWATCGFEYG